MSMMKTYNELISIDNFLGRYEYLAINGRVGEETFAHNRWLNQHFYRSKLWKDFRRQIILRDRGCDLAMPEFDIGGRIIIHHINPITEENVINHSEILVDPQNAVCVSHNTHEAIHYGTRDLLAIEPIERRPNDTVPWR